MTRVMDLNVKGVFNATRAASECMIARGNGVILSTSSMVSISGQASGIAYPTSKFAVNGLTVSLARELGRKGIPGQRGGSRNHRDRYDEGGPEGCDRAFDRTDSFKKAGTARGYCECVCIPGIRRSFLHYRRCIERRRYGAVLTGGAAWDFLNL